MSAPSTIVPMLEEFQPTSLGVHPSDKALALQVLETTSLPTTRMEAWKYTRVAKLGKIAFRNQAASLNEIEDMLPDTKAPRIVFVNGHFQASISKFPDSVVIRIIDDQSALEAQKHPLQNEFFNALNTAYLDGGCEIIIPSDTILNDKLQIIHVLKGEKVISNMKTIIRLDKNSNAAITQCFLNDGDEVGFCNVRNEIILGENAHLTIDKIQFEGKGSYHISGEWVEQARNSSFTMNTVTLNGALVRNDVRVNVHGQNCMTNLNGAYLLKEQQHVDNHTIIDHLVDHCESHELYKGVIDDKGKAVFNGKVFVRPNAQKINAFQSNGNVILSETGSVNSKPELEIYADDVKCSHGSTTGQLDEEAIFYLRARGVSEKAARQLMVSAFVEDVFEKIEDKKVLAFVHRLLNKRFGWEFNQ